MSSKNWVKEEDQYLIDNYKNMSAKELGEILNRSTNSIQHRVNRLGILSGKTFTEDIYIEKVKLINPDLLILSNYNGLNNSITCKCLIHDYIWTTTARQLIDTGRCPKCHINRKRDHEDFIKEVEIINPNIIVLGSF